MVGYFPQIMDVLKPPLIKIGKRCYRRNPIQQQGDTEGHYEEDEIIEPGIFLLSQLI